MARHTPGPWEVNTEAGPQIREVFAGGILICDCGLVIEPSEAECEANARLIAAAPELLALLKEVALTPDRLPPPSDWPRRARAAIAKASPLPLEAQEH